MTVRPLTDRELETALIAVMQERDAHGRLTSSYHPLLKLHHDSLGVFELELPTREGVFL